MCPFLSQRASLPRDNFFPTHRHEQQSCGFLPELTPSTACSIGLCTFHLRNRSASNLSTRTLVCGSLLTNSCYAGACRASGCRSNCYLCRLVDARKGDAVISYRCRNCRSHHRCIRFASCRIVDVQRAGQRDSGCNVRHIHLQSRFRCGVNGRRDRHNVLNWIYNHRHVRACGKAGS
jgi:hypothetical protein